MSGLLQYPIFILKLLGNGWIGDIASNIPISGSISF